MAPLVRRDARLFEQRAPDFVETAQQQLVAIGVGSESSGEVTVVRHAQLGEIHDELVIAARGIPHQDVDLSRRQPHRQEAVAVAIRGEDVGERGRDDGAESVLRQRSQGVLTRGTAAEVRARHQDRRALRIGSIELEVRIGAPVVEQALRESGALDALQELLRDHLVGVDVGARQRHDLSPVAHERRYHARTSTRRPSIAAAAAMTGLMRWVRPPRPCRPSKLRMDVAAQRSPAPSTSAFMPRHMEQPALRHSNPASRNTLSNPSCSACALTRCEPGTTIARTRDETWRPRTMLAAARRSSMRAFVHEPRNTRSIGIPASGVPGTRPMYSSARAAAWRSLSLASCAGSGTRAEMSATMPGVVPHVTCGPTFPASRLTCAS